MMDVAIVGAGPAGLAAAQALRDAGVTRMVVLERDASAGGVPRHCGHPGFGMREFGRVMRGPGYAEAMVARSRGIAIRTGCSVTALAPGGRLTVSTEAGMEEIVARMVLLATGIRETPRAARLVSGTRPWGVVTTGALQEMAYAAAGVPFRRPVIVGSELVAFSALLAARHAGIRPVALLEESAGLRATALGHGLARLLRVPILLRTRLVTIHGGATVEGVTVERDGARRELGCDGVIFTGGFVPEAALLRAAGLALDAATGGPVIDNHFRCSDPACFAAGNLLRPVETAGRSAREGRSAAASILRALAGTLPDPAGPCVTIVAGEGLRYAVPQRAFPDGALDLHGRAAGPHRGALRVEADGRVIAARRVTRRPEARLAITIPAAALAGARTLRLVLE